jgi:hypothetical protein
VSRHGAKRSTAARGGAVVSARWWHSGGTPAARGGRALTGTV